MTRISTSPELDDDFGRIGMEGDGFTEADKHLIENWNEGVGELEKSKRPTYADFVSFLRAYRKANPVDSEDRTKVLLCACSQVKQP